MCRDHLCWKDMFPFTVIECFDAFFVTISALILRQFHLFLFRHLDNIFRGPIANIWILLKSLMWMSSYFLKIAIFFRRGYNCGKDKFMTLRHSLRNIPSILLKEFWRTSASKNFFHNDKKNGGYIYEKGFWYRTWGTDSVEGFQWNSHCTCER